MSKIEIELSEYKKLLKSAVKLNALENAGVDNWDWYGDAINPEGGISYSDLCEMIDKDYAEEDQNKCPSSTMVSAGRS